jgi:FkbM family methyltransferase
VVGVRRARWVASLVLRADARSPGGYRRGLYRVARRAPPHGLVTLPESWWGVAPRVRVRRLDLALELDLRDNLQRTLYVSGTYEPALLAFLAAELRPGDVVADVGANVGLHALVAARAGARVIAFEPAPDAAATLRAAAARNGLPVEVVETALGDAKGTAELRADPRYHPADTGVRALGGAGALVARVPVTTFDAWAGEHGLDRLDFVKLDVEGAEAAALAGMTDSLRRLRPRALVTEMRGHGDEASLRALLAEAGYAATGVLLDRNELFRPARAYAPQSRAGGSRRSA